MKDKVMLPSDFEELLNKAIDKYMPDFQPKEHFLGWMAWQLYIEDNLVFKIKFIKPCEFFKDYNV